MDWYEPFQLTIRNNYLVEKQPICEEFNSILPLQKGKFATKKKGSKRIYSFIDVGHPFSNSSLFITYSTVLFNVRGESKQHFL